MNDAMLDNKVSGSVLFKELFASGPPVSMHYDGQPIDLNSQDWKSNIRNKDGCLTETRSALIDSSLEIILNSVSYPKDTAVEWYMEFANMSDYDTKVLSEIDIALLKFYFEPSITPFFYDANGSAEQICDFMLHKTQMFHNARRSLKAVGGRSSSYTMPYFNLSMGDYGYILAIGWSGQWQAEVLRKNDEGIIDFKAGMEDGHFRLHPGEKVIMPKILVLRYQGNEEEGYNAYRRFAMRHIVPKINKKQIKLPICLYSWGGSPAEVHRKNFEVIKSHGLLGDAYWIDAGWFGDVPAHNQENDGSWYRNAGINDWEPSCELYKNGMEEISDGARDAGLDFLLWYEPERCRASAQRVKEHPDWYIGVRQEGGDLLLNLGHTEAREWITGLLADAISRYHIKVLRIDFNFGPLAHWRYNDADDRQGISELQYMRGFYQMWDDLLRMFPELIIDNCASGGRRLDYEALRRSIPLFRSDYACFGLNAEPIGYQLQTYYLNNFVPINATTVSTEGLDTYRFRSAVSSGITISVPPADASEEVFIWYRLMLKQAACMCEYMMGDFWPLTGCSWSEKDWMAYQMNLPGQSRGMVVAYRRAESMIPAMDLELHGIELLAQYEVEDMDTGLKEVLNGEELIAGWHFRIEQKRSCRVVFYKKL